jgi:hypothetical protein
MAAGIMLAEWFGYEGRRVYAVLAEGDYERERRQLLDYIRQRGGSITPRDLTRGPRRYRDDPESAEADLERLVAEGAGYWREQHAGEHGGRPTRHFTLSITGDGDETPANSVETDSFVAVATDETSESNGADNQDEETVWRS